MGLCWVCKKVEVAKPGGTCLVCNKSYVMVQALDKLTDAELENKIAGINRRLTVHEVVRDNRGDNYAAQVRQANKLMEEVECIVI